MISLIFDTETTGIVNHKTPDHTEQPYPVQLACALIENDEVKAVASVLVNPGEGIEIDPGAANIHKIDREVVDRLGIKLEAATGLFLNFLNRCDRIVGHNIDFDIIIAEAMIYRTLADYEMDRFRRVPRVCTMQSTTDICKIPGKYGFKWPKLEEAYKLLINPDGFKGAHDALNDVLACWKLLQWLEKNEKPLKRGKR